jgi:hypothetical protein
MVRKCSEVELREGHGDMRAHCLVYTMLIFLLTVVVIVFVVVVNIFALYSLCVVCPSLFCSFV